MALTGETSARVTGGPAVAATSGRRAVPWQAKFLALALIWEGLRRARQRRRQTKELRKRAAANESQAPTSGSGGTGSAPSGPTSAAPSRPPDSDDHFGSAPRER